MGAFLALVPLLLAQPTPAVDAKPELPPAGPPTAQQVLSHLPPASKVRRAFEGVWAERGAPGRPARIAWRIKATKAGELWVETFDMGTITQFAERFSADPRPSDLPLAQAPAWLRWLMGESPLDIVKGLGLDQGITCLDVDEREVLWVLGAAAADGSRPHVRVERASGQLRRIVERRKGDGEPKLLDVSLYDPRGEGETPWLPRRLVVRQGTDRIVLHLLDAPGGPPAAREAPPEEPSP